VVAPLGFYILGNLMIPGHLLRDYQSKNDDVPAYCDCCDDVLA
jgi:hypothetical protein